jgi:hypothetical protein
MNKTVSTFGELTSPETGITTTTFILVDSTSTLQYTSDLQLTSILVYSPSFSNQLDGTMVFSSTSAPTNTQFWWNGRAHIANNAAKKMPRARILLLLVFLLLL